MSYIPVFSTNNYKIQINILYNTKTAKDDDVANDDSTSTITNDDSLNNNFYIIENMNDILIEEFSTKNNYDRFKANYKSDDNPLYIVNDSYYIDANVINTIRKNNSAKFPSYNSSTNVSVRKADFKHLYDRFKEKYEKNKKTSTHDYENKLLTIFKDTFKKVIDSLKDKKISMPRAIPKIDRLDYLFNNEGFINNDIVGGELFHKYIQNTYDTTTDMDLKEALQLFYNIANSNFANKFKYEYFLSTEIINNIFKIIQENSSNDQSQYIYGRQKPNLNNNETKENIYNKYFKYVFPNKKDINNLSDPDKDKILMFNNVYYIIKNIYLLDNTIINVTNYKVSNNTQEDKKKYYISQVSLLDLKDNITHFEIEKNKVIIYLKATLKYIIENPILQINYLIDDLENVRQSFLPQSNILLPKDINTNYSSYDKIYIHNNIKYAENTQNIDSIVADARKKDYIKNKEELFLNNKALKLFKYFFKRKLKTISDDKIVEKIVEKNIIYLIRNIFKFYNNKEFKKYYIADTYIEKFNNNLPSDEYYSITKGTTIEESDKYKIIFTLFTKLSSKDPTPDVPVVPAAVVPAVAVPAVPAAAVVPAVAAVPLVPLAPAVIGKKIFKEIESSDARLSENKIYKINVVFRCYLDKTGKKPTFVRTLVAEQCLSRAQKLDNVFTDNLYKTFNLPENYLYNKLANITRKQKPNIIPTNKVLENKVLENKVLENKVNPYAQEDIMLNKRGGKVIKKYNHSKNITLKHKINENVKFINNNIYQ
jgi:hypothetical protein